MPEEEPVVLINPEIVKRSGERIVSEAVSASPDMSATLNARFQSP